MKLAKYSFGVGDRFGLQAKALLRAIIAANEAGIPIIPVWNKSNREHSTIHTKPADTRIEADNAVKELGWKMDYLVDADHINMGNVDDFIEPSDFFTIDVADGIGKKADESDVEDFIRFNQTYIGKRDIPGIKEHEKIDESFLARIAGKYLFAIKTASQIYLHIENLKGKGNFITEVSMDEVDEAQTPVELFFILSGLALWKVPAQTIAPKFSGRFNKGTDYKGDVANFSIEFEEDLKVIDKAMADFHLPESLKLSVHSGSDKFSIYPVMGGLIKKYNKGIHIKTAGTTWLEEVIGLALADGEALDLSKSIYKKAWDRIDELCKPYSSVIEINKKNLPDPEEVSAWSATKYANTLRHIPNHPDYNPEFRQLIHIGYKVAAEYGDYYLNMVKAHEEIISQQVYENILDRHIKRLF